jgi:thioredoxin reductase
MSEATNCDVLIVGGGPAGLGAALMLGRSLRSVVVVDAGRPRNAAARALHGFLTRDGVNPREFLDMARRDLVKYGVEVVVDEVAAVEKATPHDPSHKTAFSATAKGGRSFFARKVLFATGTCDELPDLPGITACYGASVHHCPYCDGWEHRDRRLLAFSEVADKAIGLGLLLLGWSKMITVLTHGTSPSEEDRKEAKANGLKIVEMKVARLLHDGEVLNGVEFEDGTSIDADALFFNTDQTQTSDLPQKLGCELDHRELLKASDKQRSGVPGVFLAGDAEGDVQFVVVAAAEGATAAVAINKELQEEERKG